jgi:hypothetical protein
MSRIENMEILGRMGEKYVANVLTQEGVLIEQSLNHFDSKKDLIGDGKTIEVKTQVPFIIENAFSIKANQIYKCRNVDVLYFIAIPAHNHKFKHEGWLFRIDPKTFSTKIRKTKDGREMTLIPIDQPAVTPIHKIDNTILSEMMKYTVSGY